MTQNNQTQDQQANLTSGQQPQAGETKPNQNEPALNQAKAGEEEKTFQSGKPGMEAKHANPDAGADDNEVADPEETTSA